MGQYTALVTGGNRGLGFQTCVELAQQGITVILTCRDQEKGEQAVKRLGQEHGVTAIYHPLEVTSEASIKALYNYIHTKFGRLDILINNAGIFPDSANPETPVSCFDVEVKVLREAMETNVYAPYRLCQAFIPLMKENGYGRVVNISSGMGQLSDMGGGFPAYRMSKTALNTITKTFAGECQNDADILINSVCPGWVRTDMGGVNAARSVEEGVATIVWLATLPNGSESGKFFRDKMEIPW